MRSAIGEMFPSGLAQGRRGTKGVGPVVGGKRGRVWEQKVFGRRRRRRDVVHWGLNRHRGPSSPSRPHSTLLLGRGHGGSGGGGSGRSWRAFDKNGRWDEDSGRPRVLILLCLSSSVLPHWTLFATIGALVWQRLRIKRGGRRRRRRRRDHHFRLFFCLLVFPTLLHSTSVKRRHHRRPTVLCTPLAVQDEGDRRGHIIALRQRGIHHRVGLPFGMERGLRFRHGVGGWWWGWGGVGRWRTTTTSPVKR